MNEVEAHPQRVVASQHPRERRRDALRQHDRHLAADPEELHIGDPPETRQHPFQPIVGQQQRIAAGEQHVADDRRARDVVDGALPLRGAELVLAVLDPTMRDRVQ